MLGLCGYVGLPPTFAALWNSFGTLRLRWSFAALGTLELCGYFGLRRSFASMLELCGDAGASWLCWATSELCGILVYTFPSLGVSGASVFYVWHLISLPFGWQPFPLIRRESASFLRLVHALRGSGSMYLHCPTKTGYVERANVAVRMTTLCIAWDFCPNTLEHRILCPQ